MIHNKRLTSLFHGEKKITTITNASKFPFWVKKVGFLSERKLSLGQEEEITDYMVLYSLSGVVQFMSRHEIKYIRKDDLVVASCNTPLRFNQVSGGKWECLYLIFNGPHAKFLYNMIRTKTNIFNINPPSRIIEIFIQLLELDYDDSNLSAIRASALIHEMMSVIYDSSLNILKCKSLLPVQDTHVNTAINYIANNYKKDLSVDTICSQVGFTKFYFCRIFKEITGDTIHQFVNKYRVNQAKDLLSYSKLSVTAISNSVGFNSLVTFTRVFKGITGMTPDEYRKNF